MSFDHVLTTFVTESRELLQDMEAALLACEQGGADGESINAIFRAAHTIKGAAGLFALNHIVSFTHVVETLLDRVRGGDLALTPPMMTLLLECCDHLNVQVNRVGDGQVDEPDAHRQIVDQLVQRLQQVSGTTVVPAGEAPAPTKAPASAQPVAQLPEGEEGERAAAGTWHISARFNGDVLKNGMDPLAIVRYLATFGEVVAVEVIANALPPAERFDPETCYLGFEIAFRTDADKGRIESAFDFVRNDCSLCILPPHSLVADYVSLIQALPEADDKLGEILIACGTLTVRELGQTLREQGELRRAGAQPPPLGELLVERGVVQAPVVAAALEVQGRSRQQAQQLDTRTIRVEAAKLDRLIDLIGELIVAGAGTELIARRAGLADLSESATRLARLVEDVRDSALTLRMVQIGATFTRFQRVVREVSAQLEKEVALTISGAETELDKTMVERLSDPLLHLVRNALDHGIELPDVRTGKGKARKGTLHLRARHDSGHVIIEIADDGAGINCERVRRKAIERGLIAADAVLSDAEVANLIFAPGFSTAESVTNLSGRGVGMDVVKRNIEQLRGSVEIESEPGHGSLVRIRLPLTLAIIDGFLMRVGGACYVVPLEVVDECVELPPGSGVAHGDYLDLRGAVLPLLRLREEFRVEASQPRRQNVVVIRWGSRRIGLVVDALLGKLQTVIKPLSKVLAALPGVTGSTILGDGTIALILDISALAAKAEHRAHRRPVPTTHPTELPEEQLR